MIECLLDTPVLLTSVTFWKHMWCDAMITLHLLLHKWLVTEQTPLAHRYMAIVLQEKSGVLAGGMQCMVGSLLRNATAGYQAADDNKAPYDHTRLGQCWASVEDAGPALNQHWVNYLCMLWTAYCRISLLLRAMRLVCQPPLTRCCYNVEPALHTVARR